MVQNSNLHFFLPTYQPAEFWTACWARQRRTGHRASWGRTPAPRPAQTTCPACSTKCGSSTANVENGRPNRTRTCPPLFESASEDGWSWLRAAARGVRARVHALRRGAFRTWRQATQQRLCHWRCWCSATFRPCPIEWPSRWGSRRSARATVAGSFSPVESPASTPTAGRCTRGRGICWRREWLPGGAREGWAPEFSALAVHSVKFRLRWNWGVVGKIEAYHRDAVCSNSRSVLQATHFWSWRCLRD